ncbi:TetR-like C-terminal domain-containing protein [Gordonia sp. LSe1-13]|uniref:TetR-like C-terminal domain-containing protein n=1 Tax=Gordonia sesuvii TaxID=3116777 RepID=A0ABU7MH79_9ACTN|nr:TetR-like C-terminal domain-containing protein [Gordonia sp. LSe1-13]
MATTTRAANRAAMESEIRRLGREHLRTYGAAGLSLRAVARDLGVVSSAVYRYVPSRDDLLTLLLVEAYSDVADAVEQAMEAVAPERHRDRLRAATRALRVWAVDDPARWALLYGSPVPGYSAPAEQTVEPGTRVIAMLIAELARAEADGALHCPEPDLTTGLRRDLATIRDEFGPELSDAGLVVATTLWSTTIGAVGLEVFGQYGTDTFAHPDALFDVVVGNALAPVAEAPRE